MSFLLRRMMHRVMEENAGDGKSGGGGGGGSQESETFSRQYVTELRQENAAQRVARQDAERRAAEAETNLKKLGEESTAKITAAQTEAQTAANDRIIRAELKAEAIKAGMVDLDGLKLADMSTIKLNDKGEVEGADALMADLKKAKPYLFGAQVTSHVDTKKPKPGDPGPVDAKKMSKEEYAKARADIRRGILPTAV